MAQYIHSNFEAGKRFYLAFHDKGKVVMLNLLRYRKIADYSDFEALKPEEEISGEAAYRLYMEATLPFLKKAKSKVLYFGSCQHFLIGPEAEHWDAILLVEHESVDQFMAFAQNEDYLRTSGHRSAALEDSRLLPSNALEF